jgi:murein endopeptidase
MMVSGCLMAVALLFVPVPPPEVTQPVGAPGCTPVTVTEAPIVWKQSDALGRPTRGRLLDGVQLPVQGSTYMTWDPGARSIQSAGWRRWGTDYVIRNSLCAIESFVLGRPGRARVLIGDISLPGGGQFGPEYGGLGHASHQNGLDVDVYYPRRDGAEGVVTRVSDIDRVASQELIDQFIAQGATRIFVGRGLGFTDPGGIAQSARKHLDHFHVRFPEPA